MLYRISSLLAVVLIITSCAPARGASDKKLEKACLGAVTIMVEDGTELFPQNTSFKTEKSHDQLDLRTVMIEARISVNKGAYRVENYTCSFEEKSGPFGVGYSAKFYRMEMSGMQYGNFDGHIQGEFNDLMKITTAVDDVLL